MTVPVATLTDKPTDADHGVLSSGLSNYNEQQTGYRDWRPLAALLRDPDTGETLGGMIGKTSYGLLFIDLVYLPETMRGQDIGSQLLSMMEQEGIARGCKSWRLAKARRRCTRVAARPVAWRAFSTRRRDFAASSGRRR